MINADVTLRRLVWELNDWANDHKMVNDFGYGKYLEVFRESGRDYSALIVNAPNATSEDWYINYSLEIICLDYVKDEKQNKARVNSDTIAIIRDLENTMRYSDRWQAFCRIDAQFNYQKVDEFGADKAFGWIATVTIKIKKRHGICNLQALMPEYDFDTGTIVFPTCDPVTITGNSTLMETAASGDAYTFLIKDTNDLTVGTWNPATKTWVVPAAGGDPATETFNGAPISNIPAGGNKDISFYDQDFNEVGTIVVDSPTGLEVQITIPTVSASPLSTGQETSYLAGDDGDRFINGDYASVNIADISDFYTLVLDNEWGHKKRLTGDTGGYMDEATGLFYDVNGVATTKALAFPNDILRDYAWRRRWYLRRSGARSWANAITLTLTESRGGETGWFCPNKAELESITSNNAKSPTYLDSRLFNFSSNNIWSSTTDKVNTALAHRIGTAADSWTVQTKTQSNANAYVKLF